MFFRILLLFSGIIPFILFTRWALLICLFMTYELKKTRKIIFINSASSTEAFYSAYKKGRYVPLFNLNVYWPAIGKLVCIGLSLVICIEWRHFIRKDVVYVVNLNVCWPAIGKLVCIDLSLVICIEWRHFKGTKISFISSAALTC